MKLIFFLIPLFFIIPLGLSFALTPGDKILSENLIINDSTNVINKNINLINIADGSQIETTSIVISMNDKPSHFCNLQLLDSTLNRIPISDNFVCSGKNTIKLNKQGLDALQNNINFDQLKIGVGFANDNDSLTNFKVEQVNIGYSLPQYFAEVKNNKVINVIVAKQDFINTLPGSWIETKTDNSIRGNYAGIGYNYDSINDVFYSPQPYPSWSLDENWKWQPPTLKPNDDNFYFWNENKLLWEMIP